MEALHDATLAVTWLTGPDAGETATVDRIHPDRPVETSLARVARRIGRGIAAVEPDDARRRRWARAFAAAIARWRFVPGGRVWAGAGTDQALTLFNCYVLGNPHDSREGIIRRSGRWWRS